MKSKARRNLGGIRTAEDLRQRSREGDGGCWHWAGAKSAKRKPRFWAPEIGHTTHAGPFVALLRTGRAQGRTERWVVACVSDDCVNPAHWRRTTHSAFVTGSRRNPTLHAAKSTLARRERAKLTQAQADEIRSSSTTLAALSRAYGISQSSAWRIKSGRAWVPVQAVASPFAGLGVA